MRMAQAPAHQAATRSRAAATAPKAMRTLRRGPHTRATRRARESSAPSLSGAVKPGTDARAEAGFAVAAEGARVVVGLGNGNCDGVGTARGHRCAGHIVDPSFVDAVRWRGAVGVRFDRQRRGPKSVPRPKSL